MGRRHDEASVPASLHGRPEAIVIFNNLASLPSTTFKAPTSDEEKAALALTIDRTVRENAPAGWVGDPVREAQVINALFPILDRDCRATKMVFDIVNHQPGYQ
jgi:type I restriction enzyme, R subunit